MNRNPIRAGDWIEVRSQAEILATLDSEGRLDGLPFMPEMLAFCGRRMRVQSVAHKTCDTVWQTGGRRIRNAFHLEGARCDGSAHAGCQAACLLFWKGEWLKPVLDASSSSAETSGTPSASGNGLSTGGHASSVAERSACGASIDVAGLHARTLSPESTPEDPRYSCQATRLHDYSELLQWWDVRQYWRDLRYRNVAAGEWAKTLFLAMLFHLRRLPVAYRLNVWLYEKAHRWLRGRPAPHGVGQIPSGQPTPDERLGLQAGEWVEVRPSEEILRTVNVGRRNRGLSFDPEMAPYCGKRYRVAARITRIIHERTGEMLEFKNPCIVLDGAVCKAQYSHRRLLCPREITPYWREAWLKRVDLNNEALGRAGARPSEERVPETSA